MAENQGSTEDTTKKTESGESWYEKPGSLGNYAGDKIQSTLQPVGNVAGKGFETIGRPVGGLIDPTVGGLMRSGKAFGETLGVGYGNFEGGPAKQEEEEGKRMKEQIGGKEQNAENPLGL